MTHIKDDSYLFDGGDAGTQCPNCVHLREDLDYMCKKYRELLAGLQIANDSFTGLRKAMAKVMGVDLDKWDGVPQHEIDTRREEGVST